MRTLLTAVAVLATAWTVGATAPAAAQSGAGGLDLSLAEAIARPSPSDHSGPLVLNGLPNIRSTGRIDIIGIQPIDGLRIEADLTSQQTDSGLSNIARARGFGALAQTPNGRVESVGTGVSLVHNLETDGPVQPYLMTGLGASRLTETSGPGDRVLSLTDEVVFDFQFGAGLGMSLSERVKLAAGYRFFSNIGSLKGFDGQKREARKRATSSHLFGLTVRVPFGALD